MTKSSIQNKNSKKIYIVIAILLLLAATAFILYQNHIRKQVAAYREILIQYETRFQHYYYEDFKNEYTTIIDNYNSGLDSKNLSLLKSSSEELSQLELKVIASNTEAVKTEVEKLISSDLSNAYETEKKRMKELYTEIETRLGIHDFTSITPLLEEWTDILENMSFIADNLSIYVNQTDFSQYPTVSLYLSIRDIEKNQVPPNLLKEHLYLTEATNTTSVQSPVLTMKQLSGNEPVTISILAGIEHNKTQEDTDILKINLDSFLELIDYTVKDTVEITSLSTSTKLYDSMAEKLEYLKTTYSGSKCLIVLTDGEDKTSTHTWEDIVSLSNKYQIPIYTIGVGREVSPYVLERIGTRTNGAYRNINDFSSLSDTLENIYTNHKALYKIDYVSELEDTPTDTRMLHIAYQHRLYGGMCDYSYTPYITNTTD